MHRSPTEDVIKPHVTGPGTWTVPNTMTGRGKIDVNFTHEVTKETKRKKKNGNTAEEEPVTMPIPVTVYESLLGLPINATGKADAHRLRRNHLTKIEPSQYHVRYVLLALYEQMDLASLQSNDCSYVDKDKMPQAIAAGAITRPWHPNECSEKEMKENEKVREEIQRAIKEILPPTKPRDLVGYGFKTSWSDYC
jgi:hypothetical protein